MKRVIFASAVAVVVAAATGGAAGAGGNPPPVAVQVEAVATVMVGFVATNFEFDVHNCPAGAELSVVSWQAEQPDRQPGLGVVAGTQPYGPSTGDRVQHITLTAGGNFISGLDWVGSGLVACGAVVVPVEGRGQTMSQTGV